jgi:hypothetical protein
VKGLYEFLTLVCASWTLLALTAFFDWCASGRRYRRKSAEFRPRPPPLEDENRPPPERTRGPHDGIRVQQARGPSAHPLKKH